ncbi:MAG: hypothetical protein MUD01_14975, partial [Chloroflexaceae bacterium]|nr:hypothetical protein [Chloroflexaceae bacterium]
MPLLHDNAVLPHDRALPGLPTLLNPAAVAELFNRRRLVGQVQHVAISYIKYKPGTSCLVGYRLACNGTTLDAYARALRRADRLTTERGAMLICPERLLELRLFPNDRRIVGLRKINHEQQAALLQRLVPQQNASWWHSPLERLVYKPERRYVARLVVEGRPQATLKFYTPACYAAARRSHMVTNGQMLRVPRLLGKRDRHAVVAYEWLEGQLAHAALSDPATDVAAFAPVGAALAELHAQPPGGLTSRTTQHEA